MTYLSIHIIIDPPFLPDSATCWVLPPTAGTPSHPSGESSSLHQDLGAHPVPQRQRDQGQEPHGGPGDRLLQRAARPPEQRGVLRHLHPHDDGRR